MEFLNNKSNRQKHDFYATPPEEVRNILQYEFLDGNILDPCCGSGCIMEEVKKKYPERIIIATDLYNYNYGCPDFDFLSPEYPFVNNIDTIIMNPPFKLINKFISKSLDIARKKVIVLGRIQLLESKTRYELIFKKNPPARVYVYVDRISCYKNADFNIKQPSNAMSYGWFVWDRDKYSKVVSKLLFLRKYKYPNKE